MTIKEFEINKQAVFNTNVTANYASAILQENLDASSRIRVKLPTPVTIDFSLANITLPGNTEISVNLPEGFFVENYGGSNQTSIPAIPNLFNFSVPLAILTSNSELTSSYVLNRDNFVNLNNQFSLNSNVGFLLNSEATLSGQSTVTCDVTKIALNFTFTDSQFVDTNFTGTGRLVMGGDYIITGKSIGPFTPELEAEQQYDVWETDFQGNISSSASFIIGPSQENSGYETSGTVGCKKLVEHNGNYFFAQNNNINDLSSSTYFSQSARIWKKDSNNNWNIIFNLLGSDTESYTILDYYVNTNNGFHYLLIDYKQDADSNFTVAPDFRELRMYRSTNNGSSFSVSFTKNFVPLEAVINDDNWMQFSSTKILFNNFSVTTETDLPAEPGYSENLAAYKNILVTVGDDGHKVFDTSTKTELATINNQTGFRNVSISQSFVVIHTQTEARVYKLFGDYGLKTVINTNDTQEERFYDAGISLSGLALRDLNTFKFFR